MALIRHGFDTHTITRRRWRIRGQVQGVGFRPFVYRVAQEQGLTGFVKNDSEGVLIEGQGPASAIEEFAQLLRSRKPLLADIREMSWCALPTVPQEDGFRIQGSSEAGTSGAGVTVDTAVCPECVAELFDEHNPRFGYGLINCTNCGPRFSIIRRIPYDRPNTTMASFRMCEACRAEYEDPADRRFHAQPVACHTCGPKVTLADNRGQAIEGQAIALAAQRLLAGQILAIKGLGGFHLAVRADDEPAVQRLRELKRRSRKPFAVMCRSLSEARQLVELSEAAESRMASPACPILLAPKRQGAHVADSVAPGNHRLGVMLPYTPIQHLLFAAEVEGAGLPPLVMTSANVSDEPLVTENSEAVSRLGGLCDAILWHDRPIERPVDDSVLIDGAAGGLLPVRRARGFVPEPLELPCEAREPGLCVGGELKSTIAVVRGKEAILSHHLGDLTHSGAYEQFQRAIVDMRRLFGVDPRWIAHDLHPQYLSTMAARRLAKELGARLIGIQHHHAHAAAAMAEHGCRGSALAVICDGVGYGMDGTAWGGELLMADLGRFERLAHLRPMVLASGDAAARDTRRCAMALLHQAYGDDFGDHPMARRLIDDDQHREVLAGMVRSGFRCVRSSGAGRLFDGVAALLGVCRENSYEAEAGLRMEAAAAGEPERYDQEEALFRVGGGEVRIIDFAPLVRMLLERAEGGWPASALSGCFHDQFVRAWETVVMEAAGRTGIRQVVLSGGVFCNERVASGLTRRLEAAGLRVMGHQQAPPNDGGLAYGQAAIAAWRMKEEG